MWLTKCCNVNVPTYYMVDFVSGGVYKPFNKIMVPQWAMILPEIALAKNRLIPSTFEILSQKMYVCVQDVYQIMFMSWRFVSEIQQQCFFHERIKSDDEIRRIIRPPHIMWQILLLLPDANVGGIPA